jgi:tetratricopeptide (TPR) repeat protein
MFSFPKERAFHSLVYVAILALSMTGVREIQFRMKPLFLFLLLGCALEFSICHYSERYIRRMQFARDRRQYEDVLKCSSHISPLRSVDLVGLPIKWYTGEAYYFTGNKIQAVADCARAFEQNPNHIFVLDRMGELHQGLGDYNAAIACYKRALAIKPDFESSKKKLAALLKEKNL